jgi:hypothetical protein
LVGLGLSAAARADEATPARIGRLSAVVGGVQYRSPTGDWSKALVNEPIAEGVGVRSARDATAEFDIAGARVALAGASETQIVRLDGEFVEIAVAQGRVGVHLQGGVANTVEIDLPKGGVWLAAPGDYDIVAGDLQTAPRIAVFTGKALVGGGLTDGNIAAAAADAFDAAWRSEAKVDDVSAGQLGAVPLRAMALPAAVGLELDRRGGVGFRPVALRRMGTDQRALGLGSWFAERRSGLQPGPGRVSRHARHRVEPAGK